MLELTATISYQVLIWVGSLEPKPIRLLLDSFSLLANDFVAWVEDYVGQIGHSPELAKIRSKENSNLKLTATTYPATLSLQDERSAGGAGILVTSTIMRIYVQVIEPTLIQVTFLVSIQFAYRMI